ncbi:hypothetical protein FJ366_00920 [Candidatus Dependentiae bacterium]|nr:hypothetical protein [Candidatus Dependentiae bacterium]
MNFPSEKIKSALFKFATFHVNNNRILGGVTLSLGAFPLIILGRSAYHLSPDLFYNCFMIFMSLLSYGLYFVFESLPSEKQNTITANRILGMLITYFYIPMQLKFIILALIVFHMTRSLVNQVILSKTEIDLSALSGLIGIFALDVVAGICSNICMLILRIILA